MKLENTPPAQSKGFWELSKQYKVGHNLLESRYGASKLQEAYAQIEDGYTSRQVGLEGGLLPLPIRQQSLENGLKKSLLKGLLAVAGGSAVAYGLAGLGTGWGALGAVASVGLSTLYATHAIASNEADHTFASPVALYYNDGGARELVDGGEKIYPDAKRNAGWSDHIGYGAPRPMRWGMLAGTAASLVTCSLLGVPSQTVLATFLAGGFGTALSGHIHNPFQI